MLENSVTSLRRLKGASVGNLIYRRSNLFIAVFYLIFL
jgi:hypothetical protein